MVFHLPSFEAMVVVGFEFQEGFTDTFSPGEAIPQMFTAVFCCNTRLSEMMEGSLTVAFAVEKQIQRTMASKIGMRVFFMKLDIQGC